VVQSQLWKLGQLAPGDTLRFVPMQAEAAAAAEQVQDKALTNLSSSGNTPPTFRYSRDAGTPILYRTDVNGGAEAVVRASGDRYLLIEFGPNLLDLDQRFRVHALQTWLEASPLRGVIDLTPGIRSLQVHFDQRELPRDKLLSALRMGLRELPAPDDLEVPARVIHLPLSWDDEAIHETIRRYQQGVRDDAPWCPSNIEFIRRINGLASVDDVRRIVFDASYLVMGLGDVYLGAPVATPVDPRHRLVTTKYNPARTWTPPNVVGIGGAYLCVYGMEGPGGYQLVGRTLQMWNAEHETEDFPAGKPWLLRFFDQIRFFPVSHEELMEIREEFPLGNYRVGKESMTFRLRDHHAFLSDIREEATAAKVRQQTAFEAERARWEASGELEARTAAATG
jgi:urea carboxylase